MSIAHIHQSSRRAYAQPLYFLTDLYVCFGSHISFKPVLARMKCTSGLLLHVHAMLEQELEAFI
jgi:hypothetical protein